MNKEIAKCYLIIGIHKYYRTESGLTFCINEAFPKDDIFYCGNVKKNERVLRIATEEDLKNIEFID